MFFHTGSVRRDSDEERALQAFNISMTTRIDRETVDALRAISLVNITQPISGKRRLQEWKWVYRQSNKRSIYELIE